VVGFLVLYPPTLKTKDFLKKVEHCVKNQTYQVFFKFFIFFIKVKRKRRPGKSLRPTMSQIHFFWLNLKSHLKFVGKD